MNRLDAAYPSDRVVLREVGLRDGLQMVSRYPSTAAKAKWLRAERDAGVRHFEVGSFLPAKAMPQFADVRETIDFCHELGVHSAGLVLNTRGVDDALETEVCELVTVVSATEEHSQANARRSRAEAISLVAETVARANDSATKPLVQTGISMAFGCSIAGEVSTDDQRSHCTSRSTGAHLKPVNGTWGVDTVRVLDGNEKSGNLAGFVRSRKLSGAAK